MQRTGMPTTSDGWNGRTPRCLAGVFFRAFGVLMCSGAGPLGFRFGAFWVHFRAAWGSGVEILRGSRPEVELGRFCYGGLQVRAEKLGVKEP